MTGHLSSQSWNSSDIGLALVKNHHILFWKVLSKPVEPSPYNVPGLKPFSPDDRIVDAGSIAWHLSVFSSESIRDLNCFVLVYRTIEWHRDLLAVPFYFFLFWFFKHIYSFHNSSYMILQAPSSLELVACCFFLFLIFSTLESF